MPIEQTSKPIKAAKVVAVLILCSSLFGLATSCWHREMSLAMLFLAGALISCVAMLTLRFVAWWKYG